MAASSADRTSETSSITEVECPLDDRSNNIQIAVIMTQSKTRDMIQTFKVPFT